MRVYEDINEYELEDHLWSGGKTSYSMLKEMGASDGDIYNALLELCADGDEDKAVDMTLVNDTLWHDFDSVKEYLGLVSWEDDFPEVDFSGMDELHASANDEDLDEETREEAGKLFDLAQKLQGELESCRKAKEVSSELEDLIEQVEDLDSEWREFDFEELKEFIEKVEG